MDQPHRDAILAERSARREKVGENDDVRRRETLDDADVLAAEQFAVLQLLHQRTHLVDVVRRAAREIEEDHRLTFVSVIDVLRPPASKSDRAVTAAAKHAGERRFAGPAFRVDVPIDAARIGRLFS